MRTNQSFIVYFLVKGEVRYVLPRYANKIYLVIEEGEHFGHTDLAAERSFIEEDPSQLRRSQLHLEMIRRFTA